MKALGDPGSFQLVVLLGLQSLPLGWSADGGSREVPLRRAWAICTHRLRPRLPQGGRDPGTGSASGRTELILSWLFLLLPPPATAGAPRKVKG